ncbi:serine hydrolase domain-containing protein [Parasphingorhabdus halotolerans]|uniref:Beta-lactamase family protein n=1 Tax=Parasphingorhabdus halotolerans TaxID=2725558 RepID=A0A6H2DJU0_9SPHN|nr:serine hydrolase domain-containing protein [Parasphingorhabdus halotolerans]QJB68253.1 beta-lactamase family protein [Parasphingorhabdus halotolerans]
MIWRTFCGLLALLAMSLASPVWPQTPSQTQNCPGPDIDAAALRIEADARIETMRQAAHIPGATLSVVYCGKVILQRGYGFEDIERGARVDPEQTLFRIGSVSKTLTFVALMQLVEQGRVDPDAPAQTYLKDLNLPTFGGRKILVRDLFTHRSGFEDRAAGILFNHGTSGIIGLRQWLDQTMPELVRMPGKKTVYSNYGATLAGLIVENVSGEPFHAYIEKHIFGPLDMRATSFREQDMPRGFPTLDPQLASRISTGYFYRNGAFEPQPFTHIWHAAPAGSASATASDMARYMLGILRGTELLQRSTIERMQQRPYPDNPTAPGYAWGFRTGWIKGFPTFEHGGSAYTHFSAMVMVPDRQIGVFVSVNGADDHDAPRKLATSLVEGMIPQAKPIPGWSAATGLTPAELEKHEGNYLIDRTNYSRLSKFLGPLMGARKVVGQPGGTLNIQGGAESGVYRRVAPGTFHDPETGSIVQFTYGPDGRALRMSAAYGHYGFDRIGWWQTLGPLDWCWLLWLCWLCGILSGFDRAGWRARKHRACRHLSRSLPL